MGVLRSRCITAASQSKRQQIPEKLQKRMSKAKALSALAHKLGRCVYYMLKKETVFDEAKFLKS